MTKTRSKQRSARLRKSESAVTIAKARALAYSQIFSSGVERACRLGVPTLGLHTAPFMTAARLIYEALGFDRAPEYDVVQPGSPPALAYRLELGGPAAS